MAVIAGSGGKLNRARDDVTNDDATHPFLVWDAIDLGILMAPKTESSGVGSWGSEGELFGVVRERRKQTKESLSSCHSLSN